MRHSIAVSIAIAIALALPQAALADQYTFGVPLVVDESLPGFVLPTKRLTIPKGTAKFTAAVPKTAKGRHGLGIDGGAYKNIKGVPVRPGRSTSLTVALRPGDYTVFDSYRKNRKKGYAVKVHVTHARVKRASFGALCPPAELWGFGTTVWVKGLTCSLARKLVDSALETWGDWGEPRGPITVQEFTCTYEPFSSAGEKSTCVAGEQSVTWTD